jgi:hypothetical protein
MTSITQSPVGSELNNELINQYKGLDSEIKKYFDNRQNDFLNKSKSEYSNQDSYIKDRGEFLVNNKIDDLETHRRDVWEYLTNEFNKNTNDKYLNAQMMSQHKKDMSRQRKNLKELTDKYNDLKDKNTTNNRQREIVLYEYNRRKDLLKIMKIISFALSICIILIVLTNEYLPYETVYVVLGIFILLILYIIYYIYFKNPGRSRRQWDKYYFTQPDQDVKVESAPNPVDFDNFDKKLDKDFDKYLDSCKITQQTLSPVEIQATTATTATTPTPIE